MTVNVKCRLCEKGVLEQLASLGDLLKCSDCRAEYSYSGRNYKLVLDEQWVKERIEQKDSTIVIKPTNQLVLLDSVALRVWEARTTEARFDLLVYAVASLHDVEGLQKVIQEGVTPITGLADYNGYVLGRQKLFK